MIFDDKTYSVLVVSASEKLNTVISQILPGSVYAPVRFAKSGSLGKRAFSERGYDLVIINSPLPDEDGLHLAVDAGNTGSTISMVLVKDENYEETYARLVSHGVFVLAKPISAPHLLRTIQWMVTTQERIHQSQKKTASLEQRMEEIRTANHAKWLLIEKRGMTEDEAHHFMERKSMETGRSKSDVAREIIRELDR